LTLRCSLGQLMLGLGILVHLFSQPGEKAAVAN
jgi:hypothetical protein